MDLFELRFELFKLLYASEGYIYNTMNQADKVIEWIYKEPNKRSDKVPGDQQAPVQPKKFEDIVKVEPVFDPPRPNFQVPRKGHYDQMGTFVPDP